MTPPMEIDNNAVADAVQRLTDTIIKLSTALLVVPIVFLRFVAEVGSNAHPDALHGVYPISNYLKAGIFVPFGLSILMGVLTKYIIVHKLSQQTVIRGGKLALSIVVPAWLSGLLFIVGTMFLVYLLFQFPIEVPEPFRLGRTPLG
jgi:hypothetical protein